MRLVLKGMKSVTRPCVDVDAASGRSTDCCVVLSLGSFSLWQFEHAKDPLHPSKTE